MRHVRILALQLKRIGDLVLTVPALRVLKNAHPDAHVDLVLTETCAPLLPAMADCVDEALVYRTRGGSNRALWRRLWRGGFDASVDFTGRDRSALLTLAAHAPRRLTSRSLLRQGGWRRLCYNVTAPDTLRSRHTVDYYLDTVAALGVPVPSTAAADALAGPVLRVPPEVAGRVRELLAGHGITRGNDFVVVHPGTARTEKYWVPERWARVIDFCQNTLGRPCVLSGGRGDREEDAHLARIRASLARPCAADLSGQLDLLTLTAVLAEAGLVLGVDSGPMHLAAAAGGRPQMVLFGPTNPFHWRPRHPGGLVLHAGRGDRPLRAPGDFAERAPRLPVDAISTDAVIACIKDFPIPASGSAPAEP